MNLPILSEQVQSALATRELASGFTKVSVLNRKAFGEKHNLKGQALKKAHSVYLAETTNLASGDVAKQLANGNIRVTAITPNANGFNIQTKTKESIYGAKSFDHGAIAEREAIAREKAKDEEIARLKAIIEAQSKEG